MHRHSRLNFFALLEIYRSTAYLSFYLMIFCYSQLSLLDCFKFKLCLFSSHSYTFFFLNDIFQRMLVYFDNNIFITIYVHIVSSGVIFLVLGRISNFVNWKGGERI